LALGQGLTPLAAIEKTGLAEGVYTASVLRDMAQAQGIDMPVTAAIAEVLAGELTIDDAIGRLMTRPFRAEG
jgi:glycerol-3-phosphate dehydrogenase (NAD(P)+)